MRILLVIGSFIDTSIGGAERQLLLLAQGLVQRGHEAVYLATDTGVDNQTEEYDIVVRRLPGRRTVKPHEHRRQIGQVLEQFQPDVCYVRWLDELPHVQEACRRLNVPVVSASVNMQESIPYVRGHSRRNTLKHWLNGYAWTHWHAFRSIRNSAMHICNTEELSANVRQWIQSPETRTIYNGSPIPPQSQLHVVPGNQVIWVNNIKPVKRPEVFIALARALPAYQFVMIGAMPTFGGYAQYVQRELDRAPSNLTYLGKQALDVVDMMIGKSDLLLYTSESEGFGNSFLQAWMRCVPTGSLQMNLDGIIEREQIGFVAKDFEELVEETDRIMRDPALRMDIGRRACRYARQHYSTSVMVKAYETVFSEILTSLGRVSTLEQTDLSSSREIHQL